MKFSKGCSGLLTLALCYVEFVVCDENPEVRLDCGVLSGSILKSVDGDKIYSFRGIPYAEPPLLEYRFKRARPKQPWSGILDATKDGPICPQNAQKQFNMSEDCLNLNVYTRNLNGYQPVLVYIHGGALLEGSGHSALIGPQYLLKHDVVLVTFNHRLGILGFIATHSKDVPRNLGFKDQVLALKWVQSNIKYFGGNSNLVTLFGWSAGAISVGAHLASPLSNGLFHRAILMSGSSIELTPPLNYQNSQRIGEYLGCSKHEVLVDCLRSKSVEQLLNASRHLNENGEDLARKWNVVVENKFEQDRFLDKDPNKIMQRGEFNKVPIMGGWVSGEKVVQAYGVLSNPTSLSMFNADRYRTNPISLLYTRKGERSVNITDTLRAAYANGQNFSEDNFKQMEILFGDAIVRFRLRRFLELASQYQDVYIYSNSYIGRYSNFYYPVDKPFTTSHGDDLQYIFYEKDGSAPLFTRDDPEYKIVEKMTKIWTNFAKYGYPLENEKSEWLPSNKSFMQVYELSGCQGPKDFDKYISVWYKLYPEI